MKNRKIIFTMALLAMSCLIVSTVPVTAHAQELDCLLILEDPSLPEANMDADGDGLSNWMECGGQDGGFVQSDGKRIESCIDREALDSQTAKERCFIPELRKDMVDPETKDIFVILVPAPYDDLPSAKNSYIYDYADQKYKFDPLIFVENSIANGGLGLTVHLIEPTPNNVLRNITQDPSDPGCKTKAVKMTESLAYNTVNGVTTFGTPLDHDDTTVYTSTIVDLVESELLAPGLDPSIVWTEYIRHTFGHECGHTLTEYEPPSTKDGNHLPGGSEFVMERFVAYKYSKKDGYTTFYTGRIFSPESQAGIEFYYQW